MPVLTIYNHKGGVSKTTTTFNLAWLLMRRGYNVLIIDCDAQCNITEIALSKLIEQIDNESEETGEIKELPGTDFLEVLNQRISGDVPFIDIEKVKPIEIHDGLQIIRGSVDLNIVEDDLAEAHIQRVSLRTNLMRTYVCIGDFLERIAEQRGFDYILLDVGPSSGALTRACFLACDAFFIPTSPDRFNVQAIGTLSRIIDRWMKEHVQIYGEYEELGLPIKHGRPIFLGVIIQFYKVYRGRPKAGYRMWMDRIPAEIREKLFPVLEKHSDEKRKLILDDVEKEIIAAEIPDFGQLAPIMQEVGKPVFEISQDDTAIITERGKPWGGATWLQAEKRMEEYRRCFDQLIHRLELMS